jgi:hypothetical protein
MDTTTVIILAAICLGLGVVLDNLVRSFLKKETSVKAVQPLPEGPASESLKAPSSPSEPAGLEEIARLWDEAGSHGLVVEIDGQPHHQMQELSPEKRAELELTLERLSNWLGKPLQKPGLDGPVVTTPAASASQAGSLAAPAPENPQPVTKPSLNPLDVIVNAFQTDVGKPNTVKSLAEQVDEVLQEKLAESTLRGRGIRLLDLPGKGLVVLVGLDKYDGIDAVPDEEVKAILHAAVDEWGRRTSGRKV